MNFIHIVFATIEREFYLVNPIFLKILKKIKMVETVCIFPDLSYSLKVDNLTCKNGGD